jgi:hypothetical protein
MTPFNTDEDKLSKHEGTGNTSDDETTREETECLTDILKTAKALLNKIHPAGKNVEIRDNVMRMLETAIQKAEKAENKEYKPRHEPRHN